MVNNFSSLAEKNFYGFIPDQCVDCLLREECSGLFQIIIDSHDQFAVRFDDRGIPLEDDLLTHPKSQELNRASSRIVELTNSPQCRLNQDQDFICTRERMKRKLDRLMNNLKPK